MLWCCSLFMRPPKLLTEYKYSNRGEGVLRKPQSSVSPCSTYSTMQCGFAKGIVLKKKLESRVWSWEAPLQEKNWNKMKKKTGWNMLIVKKTQNRLTWMKRAVTGTVGASPIQKRDKQTCRYVHDFKRTFSTFFCSFLFNRQCCALERLFSQGLAILFLLQGTWSQKSGSKTDMLKQSQFIDPAFKLREKWPIHPGTKWMTGAHEGMINKKEGERTWAQWLWHRQLKTDFLILLCIFFCPS